MKKIVLSKHKENQKRLEQIAADIQREEALAEDANKAITILKGERHDIETARLDEEENKNTANKLGDAKKVVNILDAELIGLSDQFSKGEAHRSNSNSTMDEPTQRCTRLRHVWQKQPNKSSNGK